MSRKNTEGNDMRPQLISSTYFESKVLLGVIGGVVLIGLGVKIMLQHALA
jgi:putative Mn2+ efflux pump MntP